eukprot:ANDGO_00221.mRNA.1 hypothetical protein
MAAMAAVDIGSLRVRKLMYGPTEGFIMDDTCGDVRFVKRTIEPRERVLSAIHQFAIPSAIVCGAYLSALVLNRDPKRAVQTIAVPLIGWKVILHTFVLVQQASALTGPYSEKTAYRKLVKRYGEEHAFQRWAGAHPLFSNGRAAFKATVLE